MSSTPSSGWSRLESPFHAGELFIQERAGKRAQSEAYGRRGIRDYMPEQHRQFFAQLPYILVGSVDASGQPWASMMVGQPGFICSPDARTLRINALPLAADPLSSGLRAGAPLGLLGMEPTTRRRNRLNGIVTEVDDTGFTLRVNQSYGNCPQYIQAREQHVVDELGPVQVREMAALGPRERQLVATADTLFIASSNVAVAGVDGASPTYGADVSHRGGRAGFVRVDDDGTLTIPDFTGNTFFQTLGNLHVDPRAGLLFIDFQSGDLLYLVCTAKITWDGPELRAFVGAERLLSFHVERALCVANSLPLRWAPPTEWPLLEHTGSWQQVAAALEAEQAANAWRPFRVARVEVESTTIRSFFLEPADCKGLLAHLPGQFLPIRLPPEAGGQQRTYTLSGAPDGRAYRISVRRQGAASNWLHAHGEGAIIEVLGPRGDFTFDLATGRHAVLLSAGVGITPMIAMLEGVLVNEDRSRFPGQIYFIHGARNAAEQAFAGYLCAKQRSHKNLAVHLVHSQPEGESPRDGLSHYVGRVDIGLLKKLLPFDDFDFYLCGPQGFLQDLYDGLRKLNVPDDRIRFESFGGGAPVHRLNDHVASRPDIEEVNLADTEPVAVTFERSGKAALWHPADGTLLELAEAQGLSPLFGCRTGSCGTCKTRLLAGRVGFTAAPEADIGAGEILPCICVPLRQAGVDGDSDRCVLDL